MRNPNRVMIWMSLFLLGVAAACALLAAPLREAFMANAVFNGLILGVLAIGILIYGAWEGYWRKDLGLVYGDFQWSLFFSSLSGWSITLLLLVAVVEVANYVRRVG